MSVVTPRLLYVVTHGMSARLLIQGQLAWMRTHGFDVGIAASPGLGLDAVAAEGVAEVFPISIQRKISPAADSRALAALHRLLRRWQPDVVNASTPKAALLGMLAARAARVPARIYTLRGLRLETAGGKGRKLLAATERLTAASAHRVIAVSESLAKRYIDLGLAPSRKVTTLAAGSSNGIDVERINGAAAGSVSSLRKELAIDAAAPVIGFVGRLTRDKGIVELVQAFDQVLQILPSARLLLVGDFEQGDPVPSEFAHRIKSDPAIVLTGFVDDSAPYYHMMDVVAFPSYREGFPNVPLEAAATGLPVVGFRATGTVDAVVDSQTGRLVDIGDVDALAAAITWYLSDAELRAAHGEAGRKRAIEEFQQERVWQALLGEYDRLLAEASLRCRRDPRCPREREVENSLTHNSLSQN